MLSVRAGCAGDGVGLQQRAVGAGEHDVPPVARAPFVLGDVVVVGRDEAVAGALVDDRLVDRIERERPEVYAVLTAFPGCEVSIKQAAE